GTGCGPAKVTDAPPALRASPRPKSVPSTSPSGWTWPRQSTAPDRLEGVSRSSGGGVTENPSLIRRLPQGRRPTGARPAALGYAPHAPSSGRGGRPAGASRGGRGASGASSTRSRGGSPAP